MRSAARFDPALVRLVERLAREDLSAADIHRAVGAKASELGTTRPSYERTRQLVHELRLEPLVPGWGDVLLDVDLRVRPPDDPRQGRGNMADVGGRRPAPQGAPAREVAAQTGACANVAQAPVRRRKSYAFAAAETHLPSAFSPEPYFAVKAAASVLRAALHCLRAEGAFEPLVFAAWETLPEMHLPRAFLSAPFEPSLPFVPYLAAKAAALAARSALHAAAALPRADEAFWAFLETHFPNAFALFAFVP